MPAAARHRPWAAATLLAGLFAGSAHAQLWAGNARHNADNGFAAPTQDIEIVAESHPAGLATSARITYSVDGGDNWQSAPMDFAGTVNYGANDRWRRNLGVFPEGMTVRYAIEVVGPDGSVWVNNDGLNYFVTVSNAAAAVRRVGNMSTWPAYGSLDPGADLWINSETWPPGVAVAAQVGFSTNDGAGWTSVPMAAGDPVNGNDAWFVNLGGFPEGTTVRFYINAQNANGDTFWDSNTGSDYRIRVNSPIRDVYTDKGRHNPGDTALIHVDLSNPGSEISGIVTVNVTRLARPVASFEQPVTLPPGSAQTVTFPWVTPGDDFSGYGIEVGLWVDGALRDTRSSAADVSSDWTKFPRYGFFSSFFEGEDAEELAGELAKFHINAVQFYDWKWTHDWLVPYWEGEPADIYTQPDGRVQSFETVKAKVAAAQSRNMAAMSYTLMYGDSGNDEAPEHIEWAAFEEPFTTDPEDIRVHEPGYTIWVMDISNPDWKSHIIGQFHDAIDQAGFDGIHLDNLGGAWNYPYDSDTAIPEAEAFPQFINEARASLRAVYPDVRVAHNDVAENYRDAIAGSDADIYYTEVWGRQTYQEIRDGILEAKAAGGGKAVVLAAYINRKSWDEMSDPTAPPVPTYINDASARLMAATVFANGGFRIEIGDGDEMLVNEYFPLRTPRMHAALRRSMRDYYDFAVRYQNLLSFNTLGDVQDGTAAMNLSSSTHALRKDAHSGAIWTVGKRWHDEYDAISLINLNGVDTAWRDPSSNPTPQNQIELTYHVDKKVRRLLIATPDDGAGQATEIPFTEGVDEGGAYITFTVPDLTVWSLVIVDKTTGIKVDGWPGDWQGAPPGEMHTVSVDQGEWIYRGDAYDHRTFAGATTDSDITEVRVRSDDTYVYVLVRMQEITDASVPALGIAWNARTQEPGTGFAWIGDASTPDGSMALASPDQYATRQIMVYTPSGGAPTIRLWNGDVWYAPPAADAAVAVSAANEAIEFRINRNDLDLFYPSTIALSLASFRSSGNHAGDNSTYDSPDLNNDAIDVMGGEPGVSENAWARDLHDNTVSRFHTLTLTAQGAVPPPQPEPVVRFDPPEPDTCDPAVTILYRAAGRPLEGAGQVFIHVGRNGWTDILSPAPAMARLDADQWSFVYPLPLRTHEINVAFHDGAGTWDNNQMQDWTQAVSRCTPDASDAEFIVVQSPEASWGVEFPVSLEGHLYDLVYRTNLLLGAWMPCGFDAPGNGGPLQINLTDPFDLMFIRASVRPVD